MREVGVNGYMGCSQRSGGVNGRSGGVNGRRASGGEVNLGHGVAQGSDSMRWGGVWRGVKEV